MTHRRLRLKFGLVLVTVLLSLSSIRAESPTPEILNSLGMQFCKIPAGEFEMGSPESETGRDNRRGRQTIERQHKVRITKPFLLGKYEVTQEYYLKLAGQNPSYFSTTGKGARKVDAKSTEKFPVDRVSWFDAVQFCNLLSEKEKLPLHYKLVNIEYYDDSSIKNAEVTILPGDGYRLPTEAEWEYACRAGTTTPFHFGTLNDEGTQSNLGATTPQRSVEAPVLHRTTSVGQYKPNAFGLYDMHGNVREWCQDWYDEHYYDYSPKDDPQGAKPDRFRVLRGGSWGSGLDARSAYRYWGSPPTRGFSIGFRVARDIK